MPEKAPAKESVECRKADVVYVLCALKKCRDELRKLTLRDRDIVMAIEAANTAIFTLENL